jgi:phosphonatase-like hydrolase
VFQSRKQRLMAFWVFKQGHEMMRHKTGIKFSRRQSLKALATVAAAPPVAFAITPAIRLIVLDVGGTIVQDRGDVPGALQGVFAKHGLTVTPDEIAQWRGASKREVVRRLTAERSTAGTAADRDSLAAAIYADFNARAIEAYKNVPPIAGAEKAFETLLKSGYVLASSTGFGHEIASSIFRRLGWEKYFAAIITSDDVVQGRPSPYMIFHAMEATGVSNVAEVIAVGDTPLDLQAGTNAGARGVVGVLSGASREEQLRPEPHTDILPSVAELPALIASKY